MASIFFNALKRQYKYGPGFLVMDSGLIGVVGNGMSAKISFTICSIDSVRSTLDGQLLGSSVMVLNMYLASALMSAVGVVS